MSQPGAHSVQVYGGIARGRNDIVDPVGFVIIATAAVTVVVIRSGR